jgi:hypothetical protein
MRLTDLTDEIKKELKDNDLKEDARKLLDETKKE